MEIYLMQHGPALPKDQDPEEGLNPEGKERIHASGQALKKMGVTFDAILSSPKKRSKQTAAIVAEEAGFPVDNRRRRRLIRQAAYHLLAVAESVSV